MEKLSEINELLHSELEQGPFSDRFKIKTKQLGFSTLNEIVAVGWVKLQKVNGFDYGCLNEVVRLLEKHDQLPLLNAVNY